MMKKAKILEIGTVITKGDEYYRVTAVENWTFCVPDMPDGQEVKPYQHPFTKEYYWAGWSLTELREIYEDTERLLKSLEL